MKDSELGQDISSNSIDLVAAKTSDTLAQSKGEFGSFEHAMAQDKELAYAVDLTTTSTLEHYNPGTIYDEYSRIYISLGQTQKALDYLDRAQQTLSPTRFWELLVVTSRAESLVKGGEFRAGIELATEAAEHIRAAGIERYLERIYGLQQYLDKLTREIRQFSIPLREILDGGA